MQYESKHTLHIKATCINTSLKTACHSVWACQPIAIRRFLGGRKDYHPKSWVLLNSCKKRKKSCLFWVRFSLSNTLKGFQLSRSDHTYGICKRKQADREKRVHKLSCPMEIQFCWSSFPWITCCTRSLFVHQPLAQCTIAHTHTWGRSLTHTERLWASICMLWSCANTDQTVLIGPCLWHSSGCLYCNFLPGLIHVLSTVIPAGLWDAFIMREHQLSLWGKCKGCLLSDFSPQIYRYHHVSAAFGEFNRRMTPFTAVFNRPWNTSGSLFDSISSCFGCLNFK